MSVCVRGQALKEGSDFLLEKIRRFIELYETDNAKASYDERKENIPEQLPEESDVKIFRQYCIEEIKRLVEKHNEEKINS